MVQSLHQSLLDSFKAKLDCCRHISSSEKMGSLVFAKGKIFQTISSSKVTCFGEKKEWGKGMLRYISNVKSELLFWFIF